MISHDSEKSVTCTVIGDGMVGKTEICQTYCGNTTSEEYKATVSDEFMVSTQMMGDKYMIKIVDSSGQHDYENIRIQSYKKSDVFIVCYSVVDRDSFESVESFWIHEIRKRCKKTPIILVATGRDMEDENGNVSEQEELNENVSKQHEELNGNVSKQEGLNIMNKCRADYYVECATKNKEEVKELFDAALMSVIKNRKARRFSLVRHLVAR